jgi:G:T/U-mismatch repair DNA glycosylase
MLGGMAINAGPDGGADIPDLLPGAADLPLSVLFRGVNAPMLTVSTGQHFARAGNRFWPILHGAGFTPRLLAPTEHREFAALGYGITKLVTRSTARADELGAAELSGAVPRLIDLATRTHPRWIAFLGVTAFRIAFAVPRATFGPPGTAHRRGTRVGSAQSQRTQPPLVPPRTGRGVQPSARGGHQRGERAVWV